MLKEKTEKQYSFSGFPIVNSDGKLVGILTSRDIKFLTDYSQKLKDVMTTQLVTAPTGTQLEEAFDIMRKNKVGKLRSSTRKAISGDFTVFRMSAP